MCQSGNCNSGYGVFGDMDGGYEGTWRNGLYQGTGKVYYRNGDEYVGSFNLGLFNGKGIYTSAMGESRSGIWKKGKYLGTETEIKEQKQNKEAKRIANLERVRLLEEEKVYLKKKAIAEKADRELMARKQKCIRYGFKDDTDGMGMCLIELDKLDVLKEESANKQQMAKTISPTKPSYTHPRDLLSPDALKDLTPSRQKKIRAMYAPYKNSRNNKAFAISLDNRNYDFGNAYGYCKEQSSINEAVACAIRTCQQHYNSNEICAIHYVNDEFVLPSSIASLNVAPNKPKQNNQVDWGAFARAAGAALTAPGAFGNPQPTRICNFKSRPSGAIISGDCSRLTINIGSDTYWKL